MAIVTLRGTLANGSTQKAELEYKNTYIAIYGSGWLSPTFRGGSHNTGDAFKEVASARHRINREKNPNDNCLLEYCPTEIEFFDVIKDNVRIERLDIYCHGFAHGLNLGGFKGKRKIGNEVIDSEEVDWDGREVNKGRDLRRIDIYENIYFDSDVAENELEKLSPESFNPSAEVYFWGCNIGGQLTPEGEHVLDNTLRDDRGNLQSPKDCFAQKFAEKMGKGSVYALVGKGAFGGSVFKRDASGKNYYDDGELLPANISANKKDINTKELKATDYMKKFPLP